MDQLEGVPVGVCPHALSVEKKKSRNLIIRSLDFFLCPGRDSNPHVIADTGF